MAEVLSMLSDENSEGTLNADEQESLQIGEQMEQQQDQRLAGKYNNAKELEAAYIELQKKLGGSNEEAEQEEVESEDTTEENSEEQSTDSTLFDRLWDEAQDKVSEETMQELANSRPEDLAKMYLDYRASNTKPQITEEVATQLKNSVGGEKAYEQMIGWASENLQDNEIDMYDAVMESGDPNAAYFAMAAMSARYRDSVGYEGKLLQGKASSEQTKGFKSQAEVVAAMSDPRYDRDPAYRQEIVEKLERSNINF
tara:strand:- start:836 stop:1600 length:765 start_codon:yes stop_codon:yes gene_type:complete